MKSLKKKISILAAIFFVVGCAGDISISTKRSSEDPQDQKSADSSKPINHNHEEDSTPIDQDDALGGFGGPNCTYPDDAPQCEADELPVCFFTDEIPFRDVDFVSTCWPTANLDEIIDDIALFNDGSPIPCECIPSF